MVMGMSVTAFAAENQTSTDLQSAYNNIVKYAETNNIDLSMDYQEFINSYNGSSVQAYEQSYYSILAPQTANTRSSSGGGSTYYYNTGYSCPSQANYSKYNLLDVVKKVM